jgi:hypothetical protein
MKKWINNRYKIKNIQKVNKKYRNFRGFLKKFEHMKLFLHFISCVKLYFNRIFIIQSSTGDLTAI